MSLSQTPLMIIATVQVKPGKVFLLGIAFHHGWTHRSSHFIAWCYTSPSLVEVQTVQDLLKAAQKRANSHEEPGTVDTEGKHLPVFVVIEEYDGIEGLEAHMAAKPLRESMETFKDPDVLDGEVVVNFSDGLQHLTSFY
ncbi:hypothetical protein DFJ43DRAFT_1041239 [Lentinula guzmanii]|uniref:ABM domain-containing protein n=1 Tax=Lentinula guzmanii TaxID=2804957 RepID=A0AA38JFW4_9AGAR|nr:hypothetical protein DFJ43DRAFT_1041239 [Lentinula guzmanii]